MKKGFTLIELLAVIVILAIIALIATPIVLNIISDTKESAGLRSTDFYLDAVEFSIANSILNNESIENGEYPIMSDGNVCLGTLDDNACDKDILKVEVKGETPSSGTIIIINGQIDNISIIINGKEIRKTGKGNLAYVSTKLDEVCELKSGTPKTAGAKYECTVDPDNAPYTFYVLTTPESGDTSINLIMDRNINSDGTPAGMTGTIKSGENVYNLVPWISKDDYLSAGGDSDIWDNVMGYLNDFGPITAMNFIDEATKNWINTNEIIVNKFRADGTSDKTMKEYRTHARMPYLAEIDYDEEYCFDNLETETHAYWTLYAHSYEGAYTMFPPTGAWQHVASEMGIRPVINLDL